MSNNFIPKGLISLEKLFEQKDVHRNPQYISPQDDIEEVNIGTNDDIRSLKICASLDLRIQAQYLKLFEKYKDIFAWTYADLNTYDTT